MPRTTPHYPAPHWYGSRDWTSSERDPWPALGEVEGRVRIWDTGRPIGAIAPALRIGSADCIANGERYPLPVISRNFDTGFDSRCFARGGIPPPLPGRRVNVQNPAHQQFLAGTLAQFYTDPNGAAAALQAWLGPGATVSVVPNSGSLYPGTIVATQGNQTVVLISGTSNFQQLALQGMISGNGPTSFGVFSTSPLWWQASNVVANRIVAAGGDPSGPIVYAGHSYGGAVATVLTARTVYGSPTRPTQLFTIGAPPAGSASIYSQIVNVPQANFIGEGDPIGQLPPDLGILGMLGGLVSNTLRRNWAAWNRNPNVITLHADGTQVPGPAPVDWYTQIRLAVLQYLASLPIEPFPAHAASVYAARLGFPVPPDPDVITGTIIPFAGPALPVGYLVCDGSEVPRAALPALFATIGIVWGAGDGFTTFNLPDLRGRTLIGAGAGPGLTLRLLAQTGGEEAHQLTTGELASHLHSLTDPGHAHGIGPAVQPPGFNPGAALTGPVIGTPLGTLPAPTNVTCDNAGSDLPHNNMQPFAVVLWLIKT